MAKAQEQAKLDDFMSKGWSWRSGAKPDVVYELIERIVCDGTYSRVTRTGLALTHAKVYTYMKAASAASTLRVEGGNSAATFGNVSIDNGIGASEARACVSLVSDGKEAYCEHVGPVSSMYGTSPIYMTVSKIDASTPINRINIFTTDNKVFPDDSVIEIWGVRKNA